jgi:hypothetical protein
MCPTPTGRIHTRTAAIILPALFGLIVSLISGHFDWLALVGIYYVMGIFLDTAVYSWLFRFQPPWMTFVIAIAELGFLLVLSQVIARTNDGGGLAHVSIGEAIIFYWICWILAIPITKVVLLPLFSLTYLESAGEIRRVEWSIPESQLPLPVLASGAEAKRGPGPVVREASGLHAKPLPQLPSPSGVHRLPPQPGQAPAG